MYFKQIELTGFKSFADKTLVRLGPGLTAVVGPNGCGKSNILDSLRWALGEQSAKALRGTHMQDVIFNGSENRQPVGMAEVSLVFDNSDSVLPVDFAEVQVTRRIYRSGESEYLINKAPCRLRDVQELFMDTGVGTNAYSLISQGKIDLILSSKPEDRRFIFEEAAGIIRYKTRKRIAMRKLASAEQNLLRLGDIIAEIQRQMRSLKRQVNAAIRYRELTDKLREVDIRSAWLGFRRLSSEIEGLRAGFAKAQDEYEQATAETSKQEARYEELGLSKMEVDRVLHARRETVHDIGGEMDRIERQIALLRQQVAFSKEQRQRAEAERAEFEERGRALETRLAEAEEVTASLGEDIGAADQAIEAKQGEHDAGAARVGAADRALEEMRARAVEGLNSRAQTQTELETLGVNLDNVNVQLDALYERQKAENARRDELLGQIEAAQSVQSEKQRELGAAERERAEATASHETKRNERETLNAQWQALREKRSSLSARLHSLRELRDAYEGYAGGVQSVMRAKREGLDAMRGVIGPMGDLLSTEKKYERAVEAALGAHINDVVADTAATAASAIEHLKSEAEGRVTFLPLDTIRWSASAPDAEDPGVVGTVSGLVTFDEGIARAVEYVCGDTVVVKTLDDATRLARGTETFRRFVTLDGEVVASTGSVTGGRMGRDSRGLLGRSAEIGDLEGEVESADREIARLGDTVRELDAALSELAERMAGIERRETSLRRELDEVGIELTWRRTELENLTDSAEALNRERDALAEKRDDLDARRGEALSRADTMESDEQALQQAIAEAQTGASRAREAHSVCAAELADLRMRSAGLRQRREEAERDKAREVRAREEAQAEGQRRTETMADLEANEGGLEQEVAGCIERSRALSEDRDQAQAKAVEAENRRQVFLEETEHIEGALRGLRERSREAQSQVHRLEIDLRHNEDQATFFQERVGNEYGVTLSSLTPESVGEDDLDDDARDALIAETRSRLGRMGQVNLMAIDEYEALEKRNEFLVAQEHDLRTAREALLGVIVRIDSKIRDMFMDTFNQVGEYFRDYFRRLFNGGQARIYLLDEDDPLESGIEIEARPPGKRPQSISLLSGGESALTAIALLFSILKTKPSPFCVLDEVDAPLDDANIDRFLSLLDEFVEESQFVVITHNKQTMARADALFGVTMQERGVSQLVSVRFEKDSGGAETAA